MGKKLSIFALAIIFTIQLHAQTSGLTLKVTTNKSAYVYGEPIEVTVKITNHSDSTQTLTADWNCLTRIGFNNIPLNYTCLQTVRQFVFPSGSSWAWVWELDPEMFGLPDVEGTQIVRGGLFFGGMEDSVLIQAPRYYGGRMDVGIKASVTEDEMLALRDSVGAILLSRQENEQNGEATEDWQIVGKSVDSLEVVLNADYRLRWVDIPRHMFYKQEIVTTVASEFWTPETFTLSQNYPNPFNPSTVIEFALPEREFVNLKIYDMLGNEIETLVNEQLNPGKFRVDWNATNRAAGVYFYRLQAGEFVETKKLILLK